MTTRRLTIIGLACIVAGLCAFSAFGAEERLSVQTVSFSGNESFSSERLQQLMLTLPSGFLRRSYFYSEVFGSDLANITAFYNDNGYLEAVVADTTLAVGSMGRAVSIRIALTEGERTFLDTIAVAGNSVFSDAYILSLIPLRPGDPYQKQILQRGILAVLSRYGARGYIDATVKTDLRIDSSSHRASVTLRFAEGYPITSGNILFEGLSHTRPQVVMRELSFVAGDTIRPALILKSQKQLYRTGLFQSIYVRVQPPADSGATERDVLVELAEAETGAFSAAIGYGSVEGVRGRVEIATRNLMGTARQIGARLAASKINQSIEGSLTEPWTFGTRWQTDLSALYGFINEPAYEARRWMIRGVLGRTLKEHMNIAFVLRTEDATLRDVLIETLPADIGSNTRSMTASFRYDTRDNLFAPTRGIYCDWANEVAGAVLGGTNSFARTIARLRGFLSLTRTTVLGSSLEMGAIGFLGTTDSIPFNERFYAGGPTSLRGFDYQMAGPRSQSGDPVGGRYKFVWNVAEVRQVAYRMIGFAAFFDIGNVWPDAEDMRLDDLRTSAGIGLRAGTPIGIVRIDFGFNLDPRDNEPPNRLHFSAGHSF